MNYQSGDRLKNRYLSNDAFTSLKNKLGGRSITSLGNNRRRNSYKIANQGFDLLEYKSLIYKIFLSLLLLLIIVYIIPQTRYYVHGFNSKNFSSIQSREIQNNIIDDISAYDVAPHFLKTDYFIAKQKDVYIDSGLLVYDFFTNNIIGLTNNNSSSTINIKLFSEPGYKNDLLIEQSEVSEDISNVVSSTTSTSTDVTSQVIKDKNTTYKSYVFEGMGYGQLMAKVPPATDVKKDTYVYIRTLDGLKPVAKIINVNQDNKSTFTLVYAQLIIAPQNIYKVLIK